MQEDVNFHPSAKRKWPNKFGTASPELFQDRSLCIMSILKQRLLSQDLYLQQIQNYKTSQLFFPRNKNLNAMNLNYFFICSVWKTTFYMICLVYPVCRVPHEQLKSNAIKLKMSISRKQSWFLLKWYHPGNIVCA